MELLVNYLTCSDGTVKTQKLKQLVLKRKNSFRFKSRRKFDPTWSWWWMVNKVNKMCQDTCGVTAETTNYPPTQNHNHNRRKMFICVICQEEHVITLLENQNLDFLHEQPQSNLAKSNQKSDNLCDICYTLLKFKITSKVRKHKIVQIVRQWALINS